MDSKRHSITVSNENNRLLTYVPCLKDHWPGKVLSLYRQNTGPDKLNKLFYEQRSTRTKFVFNPEFPVCSV